MKHCGEGPDPDMSVETAWELPEPISVHEVRLDDESITTVRQHGNPSGPRLVLSHGNGLAIDLYYPFWSLLADDFELMVYDLRNHGWNPVGQRQEHNIPTLIHDHDLVLESIDRRYGGKPTVGVYHSLSTLVTILADARPYSALVLFDPPLCKPTANETEFDEAAERGAAMTKRRGYRFKSEEQFTELLGYQPQFARVLPGVRELMSATTLRRSADDQTLELRCPREYEAQIMEYVRGFAPLLDLNLLIRPTKIIGADPTVPFAYLPTFNLGHILSVDYDFMPDATHIRQLEQPEACVALMREFLDSIGLG